MKQMNVLPQKTLVRMPLLSDMLPTLLLFFASRATAMGMSPFAVAFFAASYDKRIAYIGILSALIGIATSRGVSEVPKYLIALTLYWLFSRLFKKKSTVIDSVAVGLSVALGGGVVLLSGIKGLFDIFLLLTESMTASLMYIIFKKTSDVTEDFERRHGMSSEEYVSVAITVGVVLAGLNGIGAYGISLTHILVSYVLLVTALNTPVSVASCTGLAIGFMSSMSESGAVVMMGVYGFGALFESFMNTYKKVGCFVGYI